MKPRIKNGDFVVIEPGHTIINGDEVLIKAKDGRVMVKELLYTRDGLAHLGSVNETHPKITLALEEIELMHYVSAIVKSTKWNPA